MLISKEREIAVGEVDFVHSHTGVMSTIIAEWIGGRCLSNQVSVAVLSYLLADHQPIIIRQHIIKQVAAF